MMTKETAYEMEEFLSALEAGISTLYMIQEHYIDGSPICAARANEMDKALFTVFNYMHALVNGKIAEMNEAYTRARKETKAEKKKEGAA